MVEWVRWGTAAAAGLGAYARARASSFGFIAGRGAIIAPPPAEKKIYIFEGERGEEVD
jgi:hypothetical protein